ncbi:hypothetical protein RJ639_019026, partial [Escallonia herrerae]
MDLITLSSYETLTPQSGERLGAGCGSGASGIFAMSRSEHASVVIPMMHSLSFLVYRLESDGDLRLVGSADADVELEDDDGLNYDEYSRVDHHLPLGNLPNQPVPVLGPRHHGRRRPLPLGVGDNHRLATIHGAHGRVGGPQIDPHHLLDHHPELQSLKVVESSPKLRAIADGQTMDLLTCLPEKSESDDVWKMNMMAR